VAPLPPTPTPNNGEKGKGKGKVNEKGKNNGSSGSGNNSRGTLVRPYYNPWISTISMWPVMHSLQRQLIHPPQHVLLAAPVYYDTPGGSSFAPFLTGTWDQQSLANSFSTMALTPPAIIDWVVDAGASYHITSNVDNLTSVHPPTSTDSSSIIVGNGYALSVTSVGDSTLLDPFYLNNVLITPDIIQKNLYVHHFTTVNWYSMKFDPFGLSVKDLSTWNVITRCNSSEPLYMMRLPSHPAPSPHVSTPSALVSSVST
jgi:hypothetical protein